MDHRAASSAVHRKAEIRPYTGHVRVIPVVQGESHLIGRLGDDDRITKMVEIGRLLTPDDDPVEVG
ncbi:hypothetical protein ACR9VJ_31385 [Streptomyces sp. H49]|uniref:hypothetical protein n=1 Tax=Streptomyces sp. H49 TaxID=3444117 RepID=UPI003F4AC26E